MKTKSASQTPRRLTRNAILLAITALALSASPRSRAIELCGCVRNWDNPSASDWFAPSNWAPYHDYIPGCGEQPVCPVDGGTTEANINNGGTAQISGLAQTAHACEVFLGKESGYSGNLSVNHGTLDQCNEMWVGYQGKGTLSITNGGLVTSLGGASIASLTGSNGTATVDGTNPDGRKSTWTVINGGMYVGGRNTGAGGTGLLTVTNDARVTAMSVNVYKSGTLTGNGTVSATTDGATIDGTLAPSGTLTIDGNLSFGTFGTMQSNVVPSSADSLNLSGIAFLDGRLSVTMTGDFSSAPSRYTLLHANSVDPNHLTFSSVSIKYPTGQGWSPHITYDYAGANVYLDRVYDLSP
jgi:T5SS/PEP-CTERM-associated repeat protein